MQRRLLKNLIKFNSTISRNFTKNIKRFSTNVKNEKETYHFHVNKTHKFLGSFMGCVMWFWIFYRCKKDGLALIVYKLYFFRV